MIFVRRIFAGITAAMLAAILFLTIPVKAISAEKAILLDAATGRVLFDQNADARSLIASTTKIMTALIALERLESDRTITVPSDAVGIEGSSVYLKEGDEVTAGDLIYSVLLSSANDAAATLAYEIGGDIRSFADIMNERAKEIGAQDTCFENPHGLDSEEHYTTARDLALITAEALKNDAFAEAVSTYKYEFSISGTPRIAINHNKLLKKYEGCIGVKTGYTKRSGRCLVSAAQKNGRTLIAVTLDAPSDWDDHTRLFNFGFSTLI